MACRNGLSTSAPDAIATAKAIKVASSAVTAIDGQNEKREVWELIEMREKRSGGSVT